MKPSIDLSDSNMTLDRLVGMMETVRTTPCATVSSLDGKEAPRTTLQATAPSIDDA
jgi:hypothetical protein